MSWDIPIKIDPGDSIAKAKAVENALHNVEGRGVAAGKAMEMAAGAFKSLAQAIEQERAALQRSGEIHDRLTRQNQPLVGSFRSLAEAIQREQRMLENIHGPTREYMADLQALDSLLERNKISTAEYAEQVARLNANLRQQGGTASSSTMGGGLGALAGYAGLAAGPALAGTLLAAGRQAEDLIREGEALEDRYTNLANVALKFATNGKSVSVALDEQRQLARALNADIGSTMELFDGIGDAMRTFGLTTKEQIEITRVLGNEMIISGKSVADAAGFIQRLSVALEVGEGAGRQFKSIIAEYPELADAAAEAFSTDLAGLVKLVDEGKVKLPELTRAWVEHGNAITEEAAKRKKTNAEIRRDFEEDLAFYKGRGLSDVQAFIATQSEAYAKLAVGGENALEVLGKITSEVAEQTKKWKQLEQNASDAFLKGMFESGRKALGGLVSLFNDLGDAATVVSDGTSQWARKHEAELDRLREKVKQHREETERIRAALFDPKPGPERHRAGVTTAEERRIFDDDIKRAVDEEIAAEERAARSAMESAEARIRAEQEWKDAVAKATEEAAEKRRKFIEDDLDRMRRQGEEIGRALAPLKDTLADVFKTGEFSAERFLDTLDDIAIKLLEMAALQAIGPGGGFGSAVLRGILGGKTGFDYTVSNSPLQLPGFATGGDAMVRGSGGTDSTLVMFRATPGESVHVRTPDQRAAAERAARSPVAPPTVVVNMQNDRRDLVQGLDSREGAAVLVKIDRRLRGRRAR
jgi:tape measure domain-containing protein